VLAPLSIGLEPERDNGAGTALGRLAPDRAAVGLDDLATEIEPDPRPTHALWRAVEMVFDAEELLEDAFPEGRRYTRSGVRHGELQGRRAFRRGLPL
jgi:hypothetical protein